MVAGERRLPEEVFSGSEVGMMVQGERQPPGRRQIQKQTRQAASIDAASRKVRALIPIALTMLAAMAFVAGISVLFR